MDQDPTKLLYSIGGLYPQAQSHVNYEILQTRILLVTTGCIHSRLYQTDVLVVL